MKLKFRQRLGNEMCRRTKSMNRGFRAWSWQRYILQVVLFLVSNPGLLRCDWKYEIDKSVCFIYLCVGCSLRSLIPAVWSLKLESITRAESETREVGWVKICAQYRAAEMRGICLCIHNVCYLCLFNTEMTLKYCLLHCLLMIRKYNGV